MAESTQQDAAAKKLRVAVCPGTGTNPYLQSLCGEIEALGCEIIPVPYTTYFLRAAPDAWRADVVHIHWPDTYMVAKTAWKTCSKSCVFLFQVLLLRLRGARIVWTAHNLASHEGDSPRLQSFFTWLFTRMCHRLLAHNSACAEVVAEHYGVRRDKVCVVEHANYINDYPSGISRDDARRQLGIEPGAFVFLFVGAIRGYKGVLELIEAFDELGGSKAGGGEARLIVAGKPKTTAIDEEVRAKADAKAGVIYKNEFVPTDEMQVYMAAADVVVLPYRKIFTSGSLLLAASFGKAAIVPDVRTLVGTVDERGTIPFKADDPNGLIDAMRLAVAERATLEERGQASYASVAPWGWRQMAEATVAAYR
ncbi:MAG: glycosyltransferase family 4 protein [Planctomycetota bacterium]